MIPALVLTAGLATRLRPLSFVRAKAALPVNGEPLARRILRTLRDAGVTDAVLNVHHRPETLTRRIGDGEVLEHVFGELGLHVWFRYEKYREEYAAEDVTIAIDETPVGTFVEIEGGEQGILAMTEALGKSPNDFILDSYRGLFIQHREKFGFSAVHMVFHEE